jgi:cobalt-zinc-cadmium efflux system outer membrane protein
LKVAGILVIVLLATSAWSQEPAQPQQTVPAAAGRKLNLAAALDLATRQNLDLAAARLRRAVMQAGIRIAGQIPNPSATFNVARDVPHESLFFDQPLEIGGQRGRRIEVAKREAALTDLEITALERLVRKDAREAFYNYMAARATTTQRGEILALAKRLQEIAHARFDAGDVPQLEVIQADLEVSRAQAELTVQQQEEKVTLSKLNALLNEPAETQWDIAGALEDAPTMQALADLISRAAQTNPDLVHLAQEIRVEESRRSLLRAERIPNLTVEFGSDFNAPPDFRVGPRGGLSMQLPIFTRNQGELAQSSALLRALEGESTATRRAVAARVEAAYYEWVTRQTQVDLYRETLVPAARRLESLAEESYRAGKANFLIVLAAQRDVQDVESQYRESLLALQIAFAELEETVGAALD